MQDVEKELPGLIRALLQSPASKQRELIERHYTPDCRLTHALVVAENREEIVRIFQFWRFANRRLDADINEIVLSRGGRRAQFLLRQRIDPRWGWPLVQPFTWEAAVFLDLAPGPSGWLIAGQAEMLPPGALLRPLPLLSWAYERVARRAAALGIRATAASAALLYRGAQAAWFGTWLALGATDAGPPPAKQGLACAAKHNGPRRVVAAVEVPEAGLPLSYHSI